MTAVVATPTLGSFSAVDTDTGAATLIAALDEQASIPAIHRLAATAPPGPSASRRRHCWTSSPTPVAAATSSGP